jgi:hypothetical protein
MKSCRFTQAQMLSKLVQRSFFFARKLQVNCLVEHKPHVEAGIKKFIHLEKNRSFGDAKWYLD